MKIAMVKMGLNMLVGFLKQLAPLTSNKVDDKIVREFERVKDQILQVLS